VTSARFGTVVDRVVPAQLACRIGARARAGEGNAWAAVVAIALGSFALVFSELIPVGPLADISGHLHVSVGTGGLMVVVPAVTAAVAAPLLALCSARLERRAVLVGLSALVLVSDVIAGLAPGIGVMLAARAVLGVGVSGFWVFGAGAAITLVSAAPAPAVKTVPADPHDRTQQSGRGGPAGAAARRNRSSKQCMTTTLTSPFAAIPRPRPERKELP
jgi:MFS family permease